MKKLIYMNAQKEYPLVVQQIHNEFNNAGDKLLAESLAIIESAEKVDINKAHRLNNVGFANNPLLTKAKSIEEITRNPALMAQIVMEYKQKYPLHKFISNDDVDKICVKYKLVKGNTEQYIGFVPEKNLMDIENFKKSFNSKSRIPIIYINFKFSHQSKLHRQVWSKLKETDNIVLEERFLNRSGIPDPTSIALGFLDEYVGINTIKTITLPPFDICAPKDDMISNKKYNLFKALFESKVSEVPDPVVLYPVQYGYIIVTAWGDEAADPLVLNEQKN